MRSDYEKVNKIISFENILQELEEFKYVSSVDVDYLIKNPINVYISEILPLKVKDNLKYIQIINVNEYFDKLYKAMKEDAETVKQAEIKAKTDYPGESDNDVKKRNEIIANARQFTKSTEVRRELYFELKNKTNDFEDKVYDSSKPHEVKEFTIPKTVLHIINGIKQEPITVPITFIKIIKIPPNVLLEASPPDVSIKLIRIGTNNLIKFISWFIEFFTTIKISAKLEVIMETIAINSTK